MSSRVFAASVHQDDELTATHTHSDKVFFNSSTLPESDDENTAESTFDFQGRKHVNNSEDGDQVYTLQDDESSSYILFTMPGQASANALRNYLSEYLQPHQIVNEYGNVCEMSEISNDQLAVLQAKMWTKISNDRSPKKMGSPRPSQAQVLVAGHIAKISQLLEGMSSKTFPLTEPDAG